MPRHRVGNPLILFHRKIQQALRLRRLHCFFDRGLGRDGNVIVGHDVFRDQLRKIIADFQRTEDIKFAYESNELASIIDHRRDYPYPPTSTEHDANLMLAVDDERDIRIVC